MARPRNRPQRSTGYVVPDLSGLDPEAAARHEARLRAPAKAAFTQRDHTANIIFQAWERIPSKPTRKSDTLVADLLLLACAVFKGNVELSGLAQLERALDKVKGDVVPTLRGEYGAETKWEAIRARGAPEDPPDAGDLLSMKQAAAILFNRDDTRHIQRTRRLLTSLGATQKIGKDYFTGRALLQEKLRVLDPVLLGFEVKPIDPLL